MVKFSAAVLAPVPVRILEAAEQLVCEVGAARLTLDLVAQSAGVSKGGLLYHFPSKEALLSALAHRYVETMQHCIDAARSGLDEESASDLKACVIGVLSREGRPKAMGATLLAAAANDPALLEVIRECIARYTDQIAAAGADFARAAVVALAVDGLKMREALRISSYTEVQRAAIVAELLKIAEEAYR